MTVINFILEHAAAIVAIIGLLYTTVKFVTEATQKKNWTALVALVMADMKTAEQEYVSGATRKEWVMSMLPTHAKACGYNLTDEDVTKISNMIDAMCDMAKTVNVEATAK
jgi:predicted Zn-ribbon and HTH transcriptional regulator